MSADFLDRVERPQPTEPRMHGCPEDMLTWTQMQAALDAANRERDELAAQLVRREAQDAQRDAALDALQLLVSALPEQLEREFSFDSRRVLNAVAEARAVLVEAGR